MLVTHRVLLSGVTPMPCDGAELRPASVSKSRVGLRQLDAGGLLALGEIDHREAVEVGELRENALGRAVRVGLDRHRPDAAAQLELPGDLLGGEIDHGEQAFADRAGDDILAVGRDIDVVQAAVDRDGLLQRQRRRVDDVERAVAAGDADDDAAVLGDGDVVRPVAQRHLLDELAALAVEHVERRLRLVADIDPRAVRREVRRRAWPPGP